MNTNTILIIGAAAFGLWYLTTQNKKSVPVPTAPAPVFKPTQSSPNVAPGFTSAVPGGTAFTNMNPNQQFITYEVGNLV